MISFIEQLRNLIVLINVFHVCENTITILPLFLFFFFFDFVECV